MNRDKILRATRTLARRHGVDRVIKKHIAEHLGCGMGTINYHFPEGMEGLRRLVAKEAAKTGDIKTLAGKSRAKIN